jgi:pimeloyl-ACP methyl ester carboxylesterase
VEARAARYRSRRPRRRLDGRVAVVVDDGIATGSTARAACQIARALGAARVVLAVPVAPPGWQARIGADADEMVCVSTPRGFSAIGYFGASTGAAAALWAAAEPGAGIAAVVSRGGRPDLARPRLAAVTAPTLLIVGGQDEVVLDLNRRARAELRCENDLAVVPGATHLFEEPGTLDAAAGLARDWFLSHLPRGPAMTG